MQEILQQKTIVLSTEATKMTAKMLLKLIRIYLMQKVNKQVNNISKGKQTVKQLAKQNQGMTSIEVTNENIKCFEKYARKYGVDFALQKDNTETPPKYLVFFKARDQDAILAAFKDFTANITREKSKPSLHDNLNILKDKVKSMTVEKVTNKQKEQSR